MRPVVVLGGYGNFGRPIVTALAHEPDCRVLVCGRDLQKATQLAEQAGGSAEPLALDCHGPDFAAELSRVGAFLVIHTAGPFQGQSYAVPRACIDARAHYIDLADGRAFVGGIGELDSEARDRNVLIVSGASSLPALSSAVVDRLKESFSRIDRIDLGITSGARPPGEATMRGVLAYAGKPFTQWSDGEWRSVHGWQGLTRKRYPRPANVRWIANCDVPDLDLFPRRYRDVRTVRFRAGVAPRLNMLGIWLGSWVVRGRALSSLVPYVPRLHRIAAALARFGSQTSAMHVTLHGLDLTNQSTSRTWFLLARRDHGPLIPAFPAIALARKLLRGALPERGAMPCMGLLCVEDILTVGSHLDLQTVET